MVGATTGPPATLGAPVVKDDGGVAAVGAGFDFGFTAPGLRCLTAVTWMVGSAVLLGGGGAVGCVVAGVCAQTPKQSDANRHIASAKRRDCFNPYPARSPAPLHSACDTEYDIVNKSAY